MNVTGTMIWYYFICKREVWLISHGIEGDQEDDNIIIGKTIHENSYKNDKKEINIGGYKIDLIKKVNGYNVFIEIKKSSKTINATRMQLLYYIYKNSKKIKGEIRVPKENKIINVELDNRNEAELMETIIKIKELINMDIPKAIKIGYCRNCAYSEFCWS